MDEDRRGGLGPVGPGQGPSSLDKGQIELLSKLCRALAEAKLSPGHFARTDKQHLADGWRFATTTLATKKSNEELIRLLEYLRLADPKFPSAHFLLGLAHLYGGTREDAQEHFRAQLALKSGPHVDETKQLLAQLTGATE